MAQGEQLPPIEEPTGMYALTGEGAVFQTDEHRSLLQQVATVFAGGRTVEWTVVNAEVEASAETINANAELEPEPAPVNLKHFLAFAAEHDYTATRAHRAWNTATSEARRGRSRMESGSNPNRNQKPGLWRYHDMTAQLPEVISLSPEDTHTEDEVLDLRTIHARLAESDLHYSAWGLTGRQTKTVEFLAKLVNHTLQPDEPLDPTAAHF
jgi:uncharacterized protein YifE (UPF0438 family)